MLFNVQPDAKKFLRPNITQCSVPQELIMVAEADEADAGVLDHDAVVTVDALALCLMLAYSCYNITDMAALRSLTHAPPYTLPAQCARLMVRVACTP